MPTYCYECEKCGKPHEEICSMKAPQLAECPSCGEPNGEQFHRVFAVGNIYIKGDPKTIGQQAELNAKRLGKEQRQLIAEKARRKSQFTGKLPPGASINTTGTDEPPWFRDGSVQGLPKMDKPLNLKKVKNKEKYIQTGDMT